MSYCFESSYVIINYINDIPYFIWFASVYNYMGTVYNETGIEHSGFSVRVRMGINPL